MIIDISPKSINTWRLYWDLPMLANVGLASAHFKHFFAFDDATDIRDLIKCDDCVVDILVYV